MVTWRSLPRPSLLPPLPLAVAIIVLGAVAGLRELQLIEHFVGGGAGLDFFYDIAAARIGLAHGWAAVYDRQLYGQVSHFGRPVSFGNLPVIAWLAAPLVGVSFRTALLIWMTPLVALLLAAWWVASPTDRWERVLSLLALLSAPSVVAALDQGQFAIAVVGLLALHWWLVRVERPVLAGLALGLACIKPQTVFLVPCALALTGRWRSVVAWTATVAALLGVMGAVLGPAGVMAYVHHLQFASDANTTAASLWRQLPGWVPTVPVRAVIALLALTPALFEGARRYGRAVAAAVLGSLLGTPYVSAMDQSILFVAAWLVLDTGLPPWGGWAMAASYVVVAIRPAPLPTVCVETFWLLALALLALLPWLTGRRTTSRSVGRPAPGVGS